MIKITYHVVVPVGLDHIPQMPAAYVDFRNEVTAWSLLNGLVSTSVDEVSPTERFAYFIWGNQTLLDAFYAHFGSRYTEYNAYITSSIVSVGGTSERTISEI